MATMLRFVFFLLMMSATQVYGQNLPVYKPKNDKSKSSEKISNSYNSTQNVVGTFRYTENFIQWFGSPFIWVTNRNGTSNKKEFLPEYESYINKGKLIMSGGDMKRYEERCEIDVIDGSKDLQISTYVQLIGTNVGYEVEAADKLDKNSWYKHVRRRYTLDNENRMKLDTSKIGYGIFLYQNNIEAENGIRFGITSEGNLFVNRVINSYSIPLISKKIAIPNSINGKIKLKILKKVDAIYCYANDMNIPVFNISMNSITKASIMNEEYDFSGSCQFGLFIDGNQKVSFEKFEVSGFRSN